MDAGEDPLWHDLEVADSLNQVIWDESVDVQSEIGPPWHLRAVNSIGAQQAMIEGSAYPCLAMGSPCLPWVPDLLSKDWKARSAILIVGSAYAGFIREYSGGKGMPIAEYVKAWEGRSVKLFIDSFKKHVIANWAYYDFTRNLISGLKANGDEVAGFALFDACRASFVCRSEAPSVPRGDSVVRKDRGGDQTVRCQPAVFSRYVESSKPNEWLWKRIQGSKATRIVALGTIAEHALLRCFARNIDNNHLSIRSVPDNYEPKRIRQGSDWKTKTEWALDYADDRYHLSHWQKDGWWEIRETNGESILVWRLLPVPHPSRGNVNEWMFKRLARMAAEGL
jgi:uracil-DNA glycosylase